jgi:dihydroorotase
MPDTIPATETAADAHHKHRAIAGTSLVDYRLHLGVHLDRVETLTELTPREATTVRALPGAGSAKLDKLFALAAERGLRLLFHAEDEAVSTLLDSWLGAPAQPTDYERCRPRTAGIVAVSQLIELARRYGTPAHILHVSSREEVDLLTAAGAAGIPTTFEVTGHHLSFTSADTIRQGARLRLVPAIRDEADRDRLWSALTDGQTTTIASDHAPHRLADKQLPAPDAPAGAPGVQELLSAVFTGLRRRQLLDSAAAAQVIARTLAERPAQLFGLAGRKGRIAPGLDADIVIFDPDRPSTPHPHEVYAKCGWSAYEGWTFAGRVELTLRRGEIVYDRRTGSARFGAPSGEWLSATGAIN